MEIEYVWTLAAALGAAALAATLKVVEYRHELKLTNEVIAVLRKELDTLNQKNNQCISDLQKLQAAKEKEFLKPIHYDNRGVI